MFCLIFAVSLGSCSKNQRGPEAGPSRSEESDNTTGNGNTDESPENPAEANGNASAEEEDASSAQVDTAAFNAGDTVVIVNVDKTTCRVTRTNHLTKASFTVLVGTTKAPIGTVGGQQFFAAFKYHGLISNYVHFYTGDGDTKGINLAIGKKKGTRATVTFGGNGRLAFKDVVEY
jgi:hypothetical protein